jgi:predicted nucleic acid-binding protein
VRSVLCDASVICPWFWEDGEPELQAARSVLTAAADGELRPYVLDFTLLEFGNVALRRVGWPAKKVVAAIGEVEAVCAAPVAVERDALLVAISLAARHRLTLYDAAYWAVAQERGTPLVTLDRELIAAGAGVHPSALGDTGAG